MTDFKTVLETARKEGLQIPNLQPESDTADDIASFARKTATGQLKSESWTIQWQASVVPFFVEYKYHFEESKKEVILLARAWYMTEHHPEVVAKALSAKAKTLHNTILAGIDFEYIQVLAAQGNNLVMGEAEDWLSGLAAAKVHKASIKETEIYMNQMRNADLKIEEIDLPAAGLIAAAINSGSMEAEMILQFVALLPNGSAEVTVPAAISTAKKASKNKKSKEQTKRKKASKAKAMADTTALADRERQETAPSDSSSTQQESSYQSWTSAVSQPQVASYDSSAQTLPAPKSAPSAKVILTREDFEKKVAIPFKLIKRTTKTPSLPTIPEEASSTANPHSTTKVIMSEEDVTFRNRIIHRRVASEASLALRVMSSTSSSNLVTVATQDDGGDLSDDEAEGPTTDTISSVRFWNGLRREPHAYTPWAGDVAWAYVNDHEEWEIKSGEVTDFPVQYFIRPYTYLPPVEVEAAMRYQTGVENTSAYILNEFGSARQPIWEFDSVNNRILISPHTEPFEDLRKDINHPDYLTPAKLCQYQACEMAGFEVLRHDRYPFRCQLPSCNQTILDHEYPTLICHGCGPKTHIRYCSKQHLLDDLPEHWKECGHETTAIPYIIDEGTQPARFSRRYPAILDFYGKRSFEKYRQRTHAIWTKGQYTLFLPSQPPQPIRWPPSLAALYEPRVERLLNLVFFDQRLTTIVQYMYTLLRLCLRTRDLWTDATELALRNQFWLEFEFDTRVADERDPCECDWFRDVANPMLCSQSCRELSKLTGDLLRGAGVKGFVEKLEGRHWELRVWQRRHPVVKGWRQRMFGVGFEGVEEYQREEAGMVPVFGKGWTGWGTVEGRGWREVDRAA